jgi:hypothetical protein
VYIYTDCAQYGDDGREKEMKNWDSGECRVSGKFFSVPFWARMPQVRYPSFSATCDISVTCETAGTIVDLTGSRASRHVPVPSAHYVRDAVPCFVTRAVAVVNPLRPYNVML